MFTFLAMMAEDVIGAPKWCIPMGMVMDFVGIMVTIYVLNHHGLSTDEPDNENNWREVKLREFVEQIANSPQLMPFGLNENDQCIVCGVNHKLMVEYAKKALSCEYLETKEEK